MRRDLIICLLLAAAVLAVYAQTLSFPFLDWDDPKKITQNQQVRAGLTVAGITWAFTTTEAAHAWHPLTWLSVMLDCQLYGLNPAGHHLTNLLLHLVNVLLLFAVLRYLTGAFGPPAFVAGLFAVHPTNVEAVAWLTGRSYPLCAAVLAGLLYTYAAYARSGLWRWYLMTCLLLGLGLMVIPLLVTVPLLVILLDYWPLDRIRRGAVHSLQPPRTVQKSFAFLLVEKVPIFALAVASTAATILARPGGGQTTNIDLIAWPDRLANALVSYVRYLGKTFWPADLSPLYPHPYLPGGSAWTGRQISTAAVLLVVLTIIAVALRRRYLLVGWCWFLGALLPVIGLIQVGYQAIADRYAYIPLIGLYVAVAWGAGELISRSNRRRSLYRGAAIVVAVALLGACAVRAAAQTRHWRSSLALFTHAVAVTPDNPVMLYNLARYHHGQPSLDEAVEYYRRTVKLHPHYGEAYHGLGRSLAVQGKVAAALEHLKRASQLRPDSVRVHIDLARAYGTLGRIDQAIAAGQKAMAVAQESGDEKLANEIKKLLTHYRQQRRPAPLQ